MTKTGTLNVVARMFHGVVVAIAAVACGSTDAEPEASPPVEITPTPVANNAAPIEGATFTFETSRGAGAPRPGSTGASVGATSHAGDVTVRVNNFTHYCVPSPHFLATRQGSTLRLALQPREGPVSRCVSAYNQTLRFEGIDAGAWLSTVVIIDPDGSTRLTGDVVRAR